ncbi:MAG: lipoprotein-releasing ABC transporter permease subunit [Candidatus Lariskella arthropodorum]
MIKNFEWQIACRYLLTKKKDGFISVINTLSLIGIAIGVSVLIIVMSVMNGYETELIKRILGINGHITIMAPGNRLMSFDQSLSQQIQDIPGIKFVAPIITDQAMVMDRNATGVIIRAIDGVDLEKKPMMENSLLGGNFNSYKRGEGIIIGIELARQLDVSDGDSIKLISPELDNLAIGSIPRAKTFKIIGIFDVGMHEYNSSTIFMTLKSAQLFLGINQKISGIEIVLQKHANLPHTKKAISQVLESNSKDLVIVDWTQQNDSLMNALRIERNVMFFILSLIVVIAAFNIITSLTMLVNDKKTGIAIFKTIGMDQSSIVKIFMLCGSIIGITGTIIGCILGVFFAINIEKIREFLESLTGITLFDPVIYFLTSLPSELSFVNVMFIFLISVLLSLVATIYPAIKASKLSPVVIFRSSS